MTNLITSELINKTLLEFATNIKDVATDAVSFGKEQVPLVVQELLKYEFYNSFIIFVSLLGLFIYLIHYLRKTKNDYRDCDQEIARVFCVVLSIACFVTCFFHGNRALKVKLAPRVYILEYIKGMVK